MFWKNQMFHKSIVMLLVLLLVVPVLAACNDDDDDETTPMTSQTTSIQPTSAQPTTTKPQDTEPVKIGLISSMTGEAAMGGYFGTQALDVIEYQLKEGYISAGRPVEFVRVDDQSNVPGVMAGWTKLVRQDKVPVIAWGGTTAVGCIASVEASSEYGIPHFSFTLSPDDLADYPYAVRAGNASEKARIQKNADFVLDVLKPESVGFLMEDSSWGRGNNSILKPLFEAAGIEIVYEQYIPLGTVDFSPQLTRIRRDKPDVLLTLFAAAEAYSAIYKQIMEQGGWGDIRHLDMGPSSANTFKMPGAEDTYHWMLWVPDSTYPVSQKFVTDFQQVNGMMPNPAHIYMYLSLLATIKCIEFADSNSSEDIANVMRSGNFEFDSPCGMIKIGTDGENSMGGQMVLVSEGGALTVLSE